MRWGIRFTLESRSTTGGLRGTPLFREKLKWWAAVITATNWMGELKMECLGESTGPGGEGARGRGSPGGRKEEWEGEKLRKRSSQWVAFLSFFFLVLSLVGVHHVTLCNWPVVTPELYKQISRETCQPEGLRRWMCVLCELQMWDCVGNGLME